MMKACLVGLALAALCRAGAPAPSQTVQECIAKLGSESWQEREAASAMLLSLGSAAREALEAASTSTDPEVKYRTRELLMRLRWQPPKGLSGGLAEAWGSYEELSESQRITLLTRMTGELKGEATDAVVKVLRHDRSERVRRQALSRLTRIDARRAEAELTALADRDDTRGWALAQLGQLRAGQGRTQEAVAAYERARAAGSEDERVLSALARLHERREEWPKARELYEALVDASPDGLRRYGTKSGMCYWREGERKKAKAMWQRMLEEQAHAPELYTSIAHAYETLGATAEAIALLRKGAAKHPHDYNLLRRLAQKLGEAGKGADAIDALLQARQAAPAEHHGLDVSGELARLLREQGRLQAYLAEQEASLRKRRAAVAAQTRRTAERHLKGEDGAASRKILGRLAGAFADLPEGRWAAEQLERMKKDNP